MGTNPEELLDGRIYFRLIAAVIAADGEVSESERRQLEQLLVLGGADLAGLDLLIREALAAVEDPLRFLEGHATSERVAAIYLRDAVRAARRDGEYGAAERTLIGEAAAVLGASQNLDAIEDWVSRAESLAADSVELFGAVSV